MRIMVGGDGPPGPGTAIRMAQEVEEELEDGVDEEERALSMGMTEAPEALETLQVPRRSVRKLPRQSFSVQNGSPYWGVTDLLDRPPEILIAYINGQPEAVAAIELLNEAQLLFAQL